VGSGSLFNATAIGYDAIVTSSNTIQLGNGNIQFVNSNGTFLAAAYQTPSDIRLKKDIAPLKSGVSTIMQLNPVHYNKKRSLESNDYSITENGFIAQEIQKVLPTLVQEGTDKDKLLSVNYVSIIPILTKAIQEQQAQIDELKKMVEFLLQKK
jgi:hypothetical protein